MSAAEEEAEEHLQKLRDDDERFYKKDLIKPWLHRQSDITRMLTLLESKSNVFMHGTNGIGKTEFVKTCFMYKQCTIPCIYIDTTEFYSEKLIAVSVSCGINRVMQQYMQIYNLPKLFRRRFTFSVCKNFSALQDAL